MKHITIYGEDNSNTILYIHGGGLVMGSRTDLPPKIINLLVDNGFRIISIDYPLAPKYTHTAIVQYLQNTIASLLKAFSISKYFILGRSAGANLILNLNPLMFPLAPKGLILFYGYGLDDMEWIYENVNENYPPFTNSFDINQDVMSRDESFFPYYLQLRKNGTWPTITKLQKNPCLWNPSIPVLLFHSILDPDVPFYASLRIKDYFSNAILVKDTQKKHAIDHTENGFNLIKEPLISFLQEKI